VNNPNEIPDSINDEDTFPRTVAGKIDLMVTIGKELIDKADELIRYFEGKGMYAYRSSQEDIEQKVIQLGAYTLKLASIVQLQTECIEQLYNELKQPG
jgi:hypothetical protein